MNVIGTALFAYIDPGTGGVILGTLLPILIGFFSAIAAFVVKYFWKPITGFFRRIFKGKADGGTAAPE